MGPGPFPAFAWWHLFHSPIFCGKILWYNCCCVVVDIGHIAHAKDQIRDVPIIRCASSLRMWAVDEADAFRRFRRFWRVNESNLFKNTTLRLPKVQSIRQSMLQLRHSGGWSIQCQIAPLKQANTATKMKRNRLNARCTISFSSWLCIPLSTTHELKKDKFHAIPTRNMAHTKARYVSEKIMSKFATKNTTIPSMRRYKRPSR